MCLKIRCDVFGKNFLELNGPASTIDPLKACHASAPTRHGIGYWNSLASTLSVSISYINIDVNESKYIFIDSLISV